MLSLGLSLVLALCMASLFPSSLGLSSRPAWATVMWDVLPQDLEQQGTGTGSQCSYRPCPAEQPQSSSAQLGITLGSLEMACLRCSGLCLLLSGILLVSCLCRKAKRHPREASDGGQAGGMVPGGWEPGPTKALGQQYLGQGLTAHVKKKAWAGAKGPLPVPQPFAQPQEAEVVLCNRGGNKDRLTHKGNKTEPA